MSKKQNKAVLIVTYLFLPVLIPVRVLVKVFRETKNEFLALLFPWRVQRAKKKAIALSKQTNRRIYGIRIGFKVYVYDSLEINRLSKKIMKYMRKRLKNNVAIDYKTLKIFTCENGTITTQ